MTEQEPTRLRARPDSGTVVLSAADALEAKLTQLHSLLWCVQHQDDAWRKGKGAAGQKHLISLAADLARDAKMLFEESRSG